MKKKQQDTANHERPTQVNVTISTGKFEKHSRNGQLVIEKRQERERERKQE